MDARQWTGDDERDALTQPDGHCAWCGAGDDEACDWECDCPHCLEKRRRARLEPKDAA